MYVHTQRRGVMGNVGANDLAILFARICPMGKSSASHSAQFARCGKNVGEFIRPDSPDGKKRRRIHSPLFARYKKNVGIAPFIADVVE